MRLQEGRILFVSFAGMYRDSNLEKHVVIAIDSEGKQRKFNGMFTALSYDEGKTWKIKPVWPDDGADTVVSFDGEEEPSPESTGFTGLHQPNSQKLAPSGSTMRVTCWPKARREFAVLIRRDTTAKP